MTVLRRPIQGTISTVNSSTSAINNGANFTGTWEDVSEYDSLVVAVKTDQNGYYEIHFSPDGTNVDSSVTRYYRTTQIEPPHRFTVTRKYFRVVFYNNSGSNQTYFRMQTRYGQSQTLNIPSDSTMSQDFDSISVRPTDFTTEVALGRRQGFTTWNKFGYNEDIDTGANEILASWGGTFQYFTTGETLTIVSSSVNDILTSGTGAWNIVIYGVDSNWDTATEVVSLNGTTPVITASSWIGINRISIYNSGSSDTNAGTITITATSSGYTLGQMPPSQGTSQQCIFYVARDHQFLATWMWLNALRISGGGSDPVVTFYGYVYSAISGSKYEVFRGVHDTSMSELLEVKPSEPFVIGEKSIFWIELSTTVNNTVARGRFSGKLVRDIDA